MYEDNNDSYERKLRKKILYFLHIHGYYGCKHCPIKNLQHKIYVDGKLVSSNKLKQEIKFLLNKNCISRYKKLKNIHIVPSNKQKILNEIDDLLEERLNF